MSKVIELAREAGLVVDGNNSGHDEQAPSEGQLQYFYTLARADLEAEVMMLGKLRAASLETQAHLEAENAKLRDINKLLDSALLKAYPNGCYHGDVFDLWNAARAALGETKC